MIVQECQCQSQCRGMEQPSSSRIKALVNPIVTLYRRYDRWLAIRESCRQLMAMDDRMLRDIGISRADAVRLTSGYDFWRHMCGRQAKKEVTGAGPNINKMNTYPASNKKIL